MPLTKHRPDRREQTARRRNIHALLAPLEELSAHSECLFSAHLGYQDSRGDSGLLPRFLFTGPGDRGSFLRVGIFAGVHGDETGGVDAAVELLRRLHDDPLPALGYELFVYPVCNPWGYSRDARWLKSGADMNREFWRGSEEIEVLVLEGQLMKLAFDGILSLHGDDTSSGLYGFAKGHQLTRHVLEPGLEAAAAFLPRNLDKSIDNFRANQGIIVDGYSGILGAPPSQKPRPFEIVLETPNATPLDLQIEAHVAATLTMLAKFRALISEAQNI